MRRSTQRRLERLTFLADDYLWHAGRQLDARWEEARIKLRRSSLKGLRGELAKIDALSSKMEPDLRVAQIAALNGNASADMLLDRALASLTHLAEVAQLMTLRLNELLKA
jgi:hypothetical protein